MTPFMYGVCTCVISIEFYQKFEGCLAKNSGVPIVEITWKTTTKIIEDFWRILRLSLPDQTASNFLPANDVMSWKNGHHQSYKMGTTRGPVVVDHKKITVGNETLPNCTSGKTHENNWNWCRDNDYLLGYGSPTVVAKRVLRWRNKIYPGTSFGLRRHTSPPGWKQDPPVSERRWMSVQDTEVDSEMERLWVEGENTTTTAG